MTKHEKNGRKLLILLENGHKEVHIVKNGSSQRKKDYKLLKVARYVWKGIKKGWKGVKMSENRDKVGNKLWKRVLGWKNNWERVNVCNRVRRWLKKLSLNDLKQMKMI